MQMFYLQKRSKNDKFGATAAHGRMLKESLEDFASTLESQAQDDEDAARQLRDKPPSEDERQNAWRRIEAAALERSTRRLRDLAATMRWRCGQGNEDPELVASLQRQVRRLRMLSGWLSIGLAFLLAAFWTMNARGWG